MILFVISIYLIFHTYLVYPIILYLLNKTKKKVIVREKNREYNLPTVTVIISAFNEQKVIRNRIENLLSLEYDKKKIEILIGSDNSTDQTNNIIKQYQDKGISLIEFNVRRGKASIINDLVSIAKNEILIFSDANTMFDEKAITNITRHFSNDKVGGICGYLQIQTVENNSGGKGESFYWEYENSIKELEGNYYTTFGATGGIYAIRKKLFIPLPKDKVVTDDFIIPMKVVEQGYRIVYDKAVFGWEEATDSALNEFQRKIRIGASNYNCIIDIYHLLSPKYGFIAFGLFSHKILRWFVPFLLFMVFIISLLLQNVSHAVFLIFMFQLLFIGFSIIGFLLDKISYPIKVFTLPYYFLLANLGLLIGFYRFIRGTQKATWNATR